MPNRILVDRGPQFRENFFKIFLEQNNVAEQTGTEAHNSLRVGERYHDPLRNALRKMKISYPFVGDDYLLAFAVKAMNATLDPEGFVPSALVFGE